MFIRSVASQSSYESITNGVCLSPTTMMLFFVSRLPICHTFRAQVRSSLSVQEEQDAAWNITYHAGLTPPPLRLSYELYLVERRPGEGDIGWGALSGNFGAWLLPWIALMFQIPNGNPSPRRSTHYPGVPPFGIGFKAARGGDYKREGASTLNTVDPGSCRSALTRIGVRQKVGGIQSIGYKRKIFRLSL